MTDLIAAFPSSRRRLLQLGGLAFASAAARFAHAAETVPADPVRVSLPAPGSAGAAWRPVATSRGIQPRGRLPLSWIGGAPGQTQSQLLAGALDIAAMGAIGVAEANHKGGDIVMFAPALNNHGSWIVRGDSRFRSMGDLKGRRIATQPLNTDTYRHALMAARLNGLDLKTDFEFIHGPPLANLALFERGDVDAVITIEPTSTRLIAKGAREVARVGDLWRQATGDSAPLLLVGQGARRSWIASHPKAASALAAFYIELNKAITESPQTLKSFAAEFGIPASEGAAIDLLPGRLGRIFPHEWNAAVFANIERQLQEAVKLEILPRAAASPVYVVL